MTSGSSYKISPILWRFQYSKICGWGFIGIALLNLGLNTFIVVGRRRFHIFAWIQSLCTFLVIIILPWIWVYQIYCYFRCSCASQTLFAISICVFTFLVIKYCSGSGCNKSSAISTVLVHRRLYLQFQFPRKNGLALLKVGGRILAGQLLETKAFDEWDKD